MPADTALKLLTAYRARRAKHPAESRRTLHKFLLWEHFEGKMVLDSEMEAMAGARNLSELTLLVLERERPHLMANRAQVEREVQRFFRLNAPEELS